MNGILRSAGIRLKTINTTTEGERIDVRLPVVSKNTNELKTRALGRFG